MITHELLLLGLLKEQPAHGYDIKRKIKQALSLFAGVEPKSIYYPLKVLEKQGLVLKRSSKQGRRPQRFVYELTKKGEARFNDLLSKSFLDFKRPQFSLDLSLYFLSFINPTLGRRRLRGRIFILRKLTQELNALLANKQQGAIAAPLQLIVQHNLQMLEAEVTFLDDLIKIL
ncbi:MAG: PadR family transcriptional regulator [Candidatus Omnitrophica bacterium]|nr:PadR family transcriptional regulator [Candidatus Omnitrophota bacterium]